MKKIFLAVILFSLWIGSAFAQDAAAMALEYMETSNYAYAESYRGIVNSYQPYTFNHVKGDIGEALADNFFSKVDRGSWKKINPRNGRQGLDHLYLRKTKNGITGMVAESKYGASRLGMTKNSGMQMEKEWIAHNLKKVLAQNNELSPMEREYIQGIIDGKIEPRKVYTRTHYKDGTFTTSFFDKNNKLIDTTTVTAKDALLLNKDISRGIAKQLSVKHSDLEKLIRSQDETFSKELAAFVDKGEQSGTAIKKIASLRTDYSQMMKGAAKNGAVGAGVVVLFDPLIQLAGNEWDFHAINWGHTGYNAGVAGLSAAAASAAGQVAQKAALKTGISAGGAAAASFMAATPVFAVIQFGGMCGYDYLKVSNGSLSQELAWENTKRNGAITAAGTAVGVGVAAGITYLSGGTAAPWAIGIGAGVADAATSLFMSFCYPEANEHSPKVLWKKYEGNPSVAGVWCDEFLRANNLMWCGSLKEF